MTRTLARFCDIEFEETYLQMKYLMEPRSIAIIGASDKIHKVGGAITHNVIRSDYPGQVYFVNPKAESIFGRKVYAQLSDIPDSIDLLEIIVPSDLVPEVMAEAVRKRVRGAVLVSAGFAETGNRKLQDEVVRIAGEGGIRVIGPNCFGVVNTDIDLDLTFTFTRALRGCISFVSQSGAMCCGTLDWAYQQEMGFSKFVNLGNRCDVDEADVLIYLSRDPATKVIAMYIEGFSDGRKFLEVARSVKKPIVIMKSGTSESGLRAALSHTGSIAGSDEVVEGALRQVGVTRVPDVEDLLDSINAFANQPLPDGRNVAIVSNAGGLAVMVADWCSKLGLKISRFPTETLERIRRVVPPFASPDNPVDMTGGADHDTYSQVLEAVSAEKMIDCVIAVYVSQGLVTSDGPARAVVNIARRHRKPTLVFWMGGASISEGVQILKNGGIPVCPSPRRVAMTAAALVERQMYLKKTGVS